jgi:hypothetical protein
VRIKVASVAAVISLLLAVVWTGTAYGAKSVLKPLRLQDVAKATVASKTFQFSSTTDVSLSAGGQDFDGKILASGKADFANKSSSMLMDLTDFMRSITKASKQKLPAEFSVPGSMNMRSIAIGSKAWISYPFLSSMLGSADKSKPWVFIDLASAGIQVGDLAASQGLDPSQGLALLKAISTTGAFVVGTEVVDGAKTTKYSVSLSPELISKSQLAGQTKEMIAFIESAANYPAYVWVDELNRARRFDITLHAFQLNVDMTMNTSSRFSKFNEPVSITAPKATEVGENAALNLALVNAAKAKRTP